jgi:nucleoside-diphosphate-sugar epimerase
MKPNPMSPYALSKLISEHYCKLYSFLYGMECLSLRYFNVFGPKQNPNGSYACLIPKFITLINNSQIPKINGSGEQTRDFVFVSDVVEANLSALNTNNSSCFGEVFNIGTARKISVNEVAENIIKLSGKDITPVHGPAVIEPRDALADIQKASFLLSWMPKYSFESALKEAFSFFLKA